MSKYLRGGVQTKEKYSELVNFVLECKAEVLPAVWMDWYIEVHHPDLLFEHLVSCSDGTLRTEVQNCVCSVVLNHWTFE